MKKWSKLLERLRLLFEGTHVIPLIQLMGEIIFALCPLISRKQLSGQLLWVEVIKSQTSINPKMEGTGGCEVCKHKRINLDSCNEHFSFYSDSCILFHVFNTVLSLLLLIHIKYACIFLPHAVYLSPNEYIEIPKTKTKQNKTKKKEKKKLGGF